MSATESQTGVETTLLGRKVRLYDLSQEVSQRTQMHPLHPRVEVYPFESHANSAQVLNTGFSYRACLLIMSDHASTHIDAHCHFDPDPSAATTDRLPLDLCCGEAICVDLSHLPPRAGITVADIEESLARDGLELLPGDILLLYTGHYERTAGTPEYLTEFPGLGASASEWIVEKQIKTFGVDSPTPDNPTSTSYPCHMMCRREHITHYENLANLDQVVNTRFTFVGFPLKLQGAHGGPTRAVAIVD